VKFVFTDSRHNLFHWLIVVFIRLSYFFILAPISAYLLAIGFSLSSDTISPYLPKVWTEKLNFYSYQLPYFQTINEFVFQKLNYWYQDAPIWWGMVVGIPLILISVCCFFIVFFNLYYSIFSSKYNHTHCPFCKKPVSVI